MNSFQFQKPPNLFLNSCIINTLFILMYYSRGDWQCSNYTAHFSEYQVPTFLIRIPREVDKMETLREALKETQTPSISISTLSICCIILAKLFSSVSQDSSYFLKVRHGVQSFTLLTVIDDEMYSVAGQQSYQKVIALRGRRGLEENLTSSTTSLQLRLSIAFPSLQDSSQCIHPMN